MKVAAQSDDLEEFEIQDITEEPEDVPSDVPTEEPQEVVAEAPVFYNANDGMPWVRGSVDIGASENEQEALQQALIVISQETSADIPPEALDDPKSYLSRGDMLGMMTLAGSTLSYEFPVSNVRQASNNRTANIDSSKKIANEIEHFLKWFEGHDHDISGANVELQNILDAGHLDEKERVYFLSRLRNEMNKRYRTSLDCFRSL